MNVTLGKLHYKTKGNKYIITFISNYNVNIDNYLEQIYNIIYPNYASKKLYYSNTCGENVEFICKTLKIDRIKVGKLIINNWAEINSEYLNRDCLWTYLLNYNRNLSRIGIFRNI